MDILTTLAIVGAIVSAVGGLIQRFIELRKKGVETLEQRIEKLTNALSESSRLVSEVETEIASRQELVRELQRDAERYQQLITLNEEQVDAVAQVIQGELRHEGKKSFWKGVGANFVFFLLGAILSWYLAVGF